jgi:drug/metabolite transporter (DMT)-like permease
MSFAASTVSALTSTAGASPFVLAATLSAAVAHAAWNSIAHGIKDKLVSFTLVSLGGMICAVPLVVLALAAVFAGEMPRPGQFAGVALICAGLGSLVLSGRRAGGYDKRAVLAAVATGLSIATYTTVDGIGVRLSGSVAGYIGWLMLLETAPWPFVALAMRRRQLLPALRPVWPIGLLGGALSVLAYGLVLWAQTRGALATVAALRESSIIVAAVIGSVFFHEQFGWVRIVAAVCVTAGIAVLYLT